MDVEMLCDLRGKDGIEFFLHLSSPQHDAIDGPDPLIDQNFVKGISSSNYYSSQLCWRCVALGDLFYLPTNPGVTDTETKLRHLESTLGVSSLELVPSTTSYPETSTPTLLRWLKNNKRIPDT
jgi:hypothetical protein